MLTNQYWFANVYLFLMLLFPLLNKLFEICSIKQINIFIIALFFFNSIQPMFFHDAFGDGGYGIIHAVLMVTLGYWIKRTDFKIKKYKSFLIAAVSIAVAAGISFCWLFIMGDRNRIIMDYNSPFIVVASCAVFSFFVALNNNGKGFFSKIAPNIFTVYLVNDNPFMRQIVYKDILHCANFYYSPWFVVHYLGSVVLFFIVSLLVDCIFETIFKVFAKNCKKMRK